MAIWRAKLRGLLPIGQPVRVGDLFAQVVDDIPLHHAARRAASFKDWAGAAKLPIVRKRWLSFVVELGRYHPSYDPPVQGRKCVTIDTMATVSGTTCSKCGTIYLSIRGDKCQKCRYRVPHPGRNKAATPASEPA